MIKPTLKYLIAFTAMLGLFSCDFLNKKDPLNKAIELDDNFLTIEEIQNILPQDYTKEDSVTIVDRYVKNWILNVVLYDNALQNITDERQQKLDVLVRRYKNELYTQEYLKELTKQSLDTVISANSIKTYYQEKNEEFRLNEDLVKIVYVKVDPFYQDLDKIEQWVRKSDSAAVTALDSLKLSFKDFKLSDSLWVKKSEVFKKINFLNAGTESNYIRENKFSEFKDSLAVHFLNVKSIMKRGEIAPLQYIEPSIKQILLNRKKLEFKKELEKDVLQDAQLRLKNRLYE